MALGKNHVENFLAKLAYIVLRLFPIIMQMIMRNTLTPNGIKTKYRYQYLHVLLTKAEHALMEQLPDTDNFTICLCCKILRFEHLIYKPVGGWITEPPDTQLHIGSDIQRIICMTNDLLCKQHMDITENYYKTFLVKLEDITSRVDNYIESDTCVTASNKIRAEMENIDKEKCLNELASLQQIGGRKEIESLMEEKNLSECHLLLENYIDGDICEFLSLILEKALKTIDPKITDKIFSRVVQESPILIKEFRKNYPNVVNVWIGIKCTCDQENKKQYEHAICCQGSPLFIVDIVDSKTSDHFLGFKILQNETRPKPVDEATQIADEMAKQVKNLDEVPGSVAKELFRKHSNLNMVCPSGFKSSSFHSETAKLQEISCIQLYCKRKGIIPIGESHFPLTIKGIPTDVLEGTANLLSRINIGDKIVNRKNKHGTLGGFVKYYGMDTLLTCSHVVFGKDDISKLQKKHIHLECHSIRKNIEEPVECVLIRHILKYDSVEKDMEVDDEHKNSLPSQENPNETSIDAALLLVQIPKISILFRSQVTGSSTLPGDRNTEASPPETNPVELSIRLQHDGDITFNKFKEYGLDSLYLNDNYLDLKDVTNQAVALSAYSGQQEGYVKVNKEKEINILIPTHVRTRDDMIFYNQLAVQNMRFQEGDSGTCIYAKCSISGRTGCIGMLIGQSTSGQYIVTPMKDILEALGVN